MIYVHQPTHRVGFFFLMSLMVLLAVAFGVHAMRDQEERVTLSTDALSRANNTSVNAGPSVSNHSDTASSASMQTRVRPPWLRPLVFQSLEKLRHDAGVIRDPAQLKAKMRDMAKASLPPDIFEEFQYLIVRYVDYIDALMSVQPTMTGTDHVALLKQQLEVRTALRKKYFTAQEYDVFFSEEDAVTAYNLQRLEIERHPQWTQQEKNQKIADAEAALPEAVQQARQAVVAHLDIQAQTQAFEKAHVSSEDRFAQRAKQYGVDSARRLQALDAENQEWTSRLNQYKQALDQKSTSTDLEALRNQLFSPTEQLRLEGALASQ